MGKKMKLHERREDDWWGTVMEGESWRQRRGNWRVKVEQLRGLGLRRLKGGNAPVTK